MGTLREAIVDRLDQLPEPRLREVLDFVEFLVWRGAAAGEEPLLDVAGTLPGEPLSGGEIERELYGR